MKNTTKMNRLRRQMKAERRKWETEQELKIAQMTNKGIKSIVMVLKKDKTQEIIKY